MSNTHYITALRFPLALLVVFIHTHNAQWQLIETGSAPTLASFLSGILPTFAVPLFFALSGYLFFYKVSAFSLDCYVGKVRRRMLTLAVPYLLWNLIAFGLYALQSKLSGHALAYPFSPELWWNCRELAAPFTNVWGFTVGASTAPIQQPLWFMRDLMLIVLLSPLIYGLLRRGGWWKLLVLGAVYYTGLWPNPGGISFMGIWYFSLGAWFSITRRDVVSFTRPWLIPAAVLTPLCAIVLTWFGMGHSTANQVAQSIYVLSAMTLAIHAAHNFASTHTPSAWLAHSSFFIYAAHTIVLLPLTAVVARSVAGSGMLLQGVAFVGCALLATMICAATYRVLHRFMPRLSAPLTGQYK